MTQISIEQMREMAESFRVSLLLAEMIGDNAYARDDISTEAGDEIAEDAAIIADRLRAIQKILDQAMPSFTGFLSQAECEARERAEVAIRKDQQS